MPEQCLGGKPMESVSTFLGMDLDYQTADTICCHNHIYAEYRGYLEAPEVNLFGHLNEDEETVFYDSVCGIPLFIAPRGRSFEEFKEESLSHGWPSFRPEEIVSENVIIHENGRMESKCYTHLGHNLPSEGRDRYCIDLVCIAGEPLSVTKNATTTPSFGGLFPNEFNQSAYVSSAQQSSGKTTSNHLLKILFGYILGAAIVISATVMLIKRRKRF